MLDGYYLISGDAWKCTLLFENLVHHPSHPFIRGILIQTLRPCAFAIVETGLLLRHNHIF